MERDRKGEGERERGGGEREDLSQLKRSRLVSSWFCRMLTDDGPVAE